MKGFVIEHLGLALIAILAWVGSAAGTEIAAMPGSCFTFDRCGGKADSIVILGKIKKGDANKFRDAVKQTDPAVLTNVMLRSNGGDVAEAMQIGRDVRALLLETEAPVLNYYANNNFTYMGGDSPVCTEKGYGQFNGPGTGARIAPARVHAS